jgi:hypothetical protein
VRGTVLGHAADEGDSVTGGAAESGGTVGSDRMIDTGGAADSGGEADTSGAADTGGAANTGGAADTGGATITGGPAQMGVCGAGTTGGAADMGGAATTDGAVNTGSVPSATDTGSPHTPSHTSPSSVISTPLSVVIDQLTHPIESKVCSLAESEEAAGLGSGAVTDGAADSDTATTDGTTVTGSTAIRGGAAAADEGSDTNAGGPANSSACGGADSQLRAGSPGLGWRPRLHPPRHYWRSCLSSKALRVELSTPPPSTPASRACASRDHEGICRALAWGGTPTGSR